MPTYRLCLLGPTGRIAKVRRYWANTDEGAVAMARETVREVSGWVLAVGAGRF
jgi:hypothetical protein